MGKEAGTALGTGWSWAELTHLLSRKGKDVPAPRSWGATRGQGTPLRGRAEVTEGGTVAAGTLCLTPRAQLVTLPRATLEQGTEPGSAGLAGDKGSQWGWEGGWHAPGLWRTRGTREWEQKGKGAWRSQAIQQAATLAWEAGLSPAPGAACPSQRSPRGGGTQRQAPPRRPRHQHGRLLAVTRHRAPDQRETEARMETRGHER